MTEWNRTTFRPKRTTLSGNGCLVLCWVACLLATSPGYLSAQGVCDRTPQVRDKLLEITGVLECQDVTDKDLAQVTELLLWHSNISTLKEHDFRGLSSLQELFLTFNSISVLPEGIFGGLNELETLWLYDNRLSSLPEGVFRGLSSLRGLLLDRNQITELPAGIFSGLDELRVLWLDENQLSSLPEGIFDDLSNLLKLLLAQNSITTLPEGIFSELSALEELWLASNQLTELSVGVFQEQGNLVTLLLGENELTALPEGIFNRLNSLEALNLRINSLRGLTRGVFTGLTGLRVLMLGGNALNPLPADIFTDLSTLEYVELWGNQLSSLPASIFNGLNSLKLLGLSDNSLSSFSEGVFDGLSSLQSLSLSENDLTALSKNVIEDLSALRSLGLSENDLDTLPVGILDEFLDTLGKPVDPVITRNTFTFVLSDGLHVDSHLKATVAFESTEQAVVEGSRVRVPVSLSRALPVAVRVPYSTGMSGTTAGLTEISPSPDGGLMFLAGETRKEIVFGLPEDAGSQGDGTVILALGKLSEIRLRRSDGTGPDAPYLSARVLLDRSDEGTVHTVTVTDLEPADRKPYCISLWEGSPCSTVAVLPHVIVGPLGESIARTELAITHRDPRMAGCEVAVLFHNGTTEAPAVAFNGRFPHENLFHSAISKGGAENLILSAPDSEELAAGAIFVFTRTPCTADSLHVAGRYLVENKNDGEIAEILMVETQSAHDWMANGDCRVLTGVFGNGRNVGLSSVTAEPSRSAPSGTRLRFQALDLEGNFIEAPPGLEISGDYQYLSSWVFDRPTIIEMCLDVPGTSQFRLAVTAIGTKVAAGGMQFVSERFPTEPDPAESSSQP